MWSLEKEKVSVVTNNFEVAKKELSYPIKLSLQWGKFYS